MRAERLLRQHADDLGGLCRHVRRLTIDYSPRHQQRTLEAFGDVDAELRQQPAHHVHQLGALPDQ